MMTEINDSIQVLRWKENITLKNVEQFRHTMKELIQQPQEYLILNLADTTYINSAGLGIIADSVMQARKDQKELVIAEINDAVQEIFSIVKFTSFMKTFSEESEAISFFVENQHEKYDV